MDFVISANEAKETAALHTLEGAVEVAKSENALIQEGGVMVRGGEAIEAAPGKLGEPHPFDLAKFAEEMRKTQPQLEVPAQTPTPPTAEEQIFKRSSL